MIFSSENLLGKVTYLVAFFSLFISVQLNGNDNSSFPFRALWIIRSSITTEKEIDQALTFAQKNHFNHVFVQVRGRGDAFYNSKIVTKASLISDQEFDPLLYVVKKGHSLGLSVHAWVNAYLIWSSDVEPTSETHLLFQHPEWIDKSSIFEQSPAENEIYYNNNHNNYQFLSPLAPGVTEFLLEVFEEILRNYDIDGLHLDYIRYQDMEFGYNPLARMKFENLYGIDPLQLFSMDPNDSQRIPEEKLDDLRNQWNQYRRDAINDLIEKTSKMILTIDPSCILSVAVKPNLEVAKKRFFQEWDRWLMQGLVDYVVPMNYETSLIEFAKNIDIIHEQIPRKYFPGIIMGTSVYNQNAIDATNKIKYTKVNGFSGISLFSYDSHKNNLEYFVPIINELLK